MNFAETHHHPVAQGRSVVRIKRFDRQEDRRIMALSAASLLQLQYPPVTRAEVEDASYPRLAEELKRIGAPSEDRLELFRRMIFNAVIGNDDDHPRNHAVIYSQKEGRWRLAPAFDVVPNPDESPHRLAMQLSAGRSDISRAAILQDAAFFGIKSLKDAADILASTIDQIMRSFGEVAPLLNDELRLLLRRRLDELELTL
jgi:serine/threonine-protein kinase HipA